MCLVSVVSVLFSLCILFLISYIFCVLILVISISVVGVWNGDEL